LLIFCMSSKFLIIGTFHLRPVALGQGPWRVWVDFVRGLLRADTTHVGRLKRSSRRFCELM
jgi:hypothetical protein